MKTAKYLLI